MRSRHTKRRRAEQRAVQSPQRGGPPRFNLAWHVAALPLLPICGAIASLLLFWAYHVQSDPAAINLAGRQRMIAAQLGHWADMVGAGQDEDRAGLAERIATFETTLQVLERGGATDGYRLQHGVRGGGEALAEVRQVWVEVAPRLQAIAARPARSQEFVDAFSGLGADIERLRTSSDDVVRRLESESRDARLRLLWFLALVAAMSVALFALALWHAHRNVVQPVRLIDAAARRVRDGDLTARVEVPRGVELFDLAETFNEMVARVQELLVALDLRRRHAEILVGNLPEGCALVDEDLVVVRSWRPFQEMLGRTEVELQGASVAELLPDQGVIDRLRAVLSTGSRMPGRQLELAGRDGAPRQWRVHAAATKLADGERDEAVRLVLLLEDRTQEQLLRAGAEEVEGQRQLLLRAIEQSANTVLITAADGRIEYVNPQFTRSTGYTAEEARGHNPRFLKSGETSPEVYETMWRTLIAGETWHGQLCNRKKDGSLFWESATISPVLAADGSVGQYVAVKEDVTDRRATAAALERRVEELSALTAMATVVNECTRAEVLLERAREELSRRLGLVAELAVSGESAADDACRPGSPSEVSVPLVGSVGQLGVMHLRSDQPGFVDAGRLEMLRAMGRQIGVGLERIRLTRSIREAEERYRTLFDHAPLGLGIVDVHGKILAFNAAMAAPGGTPRRTSVAWAGWAPCTPIRGTGSGCCRPSRSGIRSSASRSTSSARTGAGTRPC